MLAAAGDVFARQGFHGASMDAIAAAADISKPMLYEYFGSKEGLYQAYIEQSAAALLDAVRNAAPPGAPPRDRLEAGVLAFLTYVDGHRAGWSVLYNEAVSQAGLVAADVAAIRGRLAEMIGRSLPLGQIDPAARSACAHALAGAGESLANWWLDNPRQPKERVAELFMVLADAVTAPGGRSRVPGLSGRLGDERSKVRREV
jgi:AcrR family transcriptional regulator